MTRPSASTRPSPERRGRRAARQQHGFTLVELLVALVILGFVMTLVSEAIFQVSQITRVADATTRGLTSRWGAGWSASGLFANLAVPEESKAPSMEGSSSRVAGFTTLPLDGSTTGVHRFELELRPAADRSTSTELVARTRTNSSVSGDASVVALFPARAEFAFVDRAGKTLPGWPGVTRKEIDAEELTRAVVVREVGSGNVLMWYPFLGETARLPPRGKPFWETL